MTASSATARSNTRKQQTLKKAVTTKGVGLFTGEDVEVRLCPASENSGIVFQRMDLPGEPFFPASLSHVVKTVRCTLLGGENGSVQTVEHILSSLSAYSIDNLLIQLHGPEVPVGDGSSSIFVNLIAEAGIEQQSEDITIGYLEKPVSWSDGETHIIALPSDSYQISYTLHYPHSRFLGSQYYSFKVGAEEYQKDIATCRTFSLYEEIAPMVKAGIVKGGGVA